MTLRETRLPAWLLLAVSIFLATGAAQAQTPSTDRDNPTAVTSNTISGDGVDEKTEYFYTFTAGPGDVTVTLDVKAEKNVAVSSVDIALYDAKSKSLLSTYANPDHGSSKRTVETVKVRGTQALLLEVTVSPGVDTFKIKLDGAVQITPATGTDAPSATPTAEPTATPTPMAIERSDTPSPPPANSDSVQFVRAIFRQPVLPFAWRFADAREITSNASTDLRLPKPQLTIKVQANQDVVYYSLLISNSSAFDARRFTVVRRLPPSPCNPEGKARLLISYYTNTGKRLGCRALSSSQDLARTELRFLKKDAPSSIYVTVTDDQTRETVRSNLVAIDN